MRPDDGARLQHALDAARKAIAFVAGATREDLDRDERLALSLVHLLEIVGEACNGVSETFQKSHPNVPWREAIALRHRLAHGYFDIDYDIVWITVTKKLPTVILSLESAARDL